MGNRMLKLAKYDSGNSNEHFTLKIQSPWSKNHFMKYQFPEWAYIAMSEFCLLGYTGKESTHLQPKQFPDLCFNKEGSKAWWSLTYPTNVTLEGEVAIVSENKIETKLSIVNRAKRFFPGIDFCTCLNLLEMGEDYNSTDPALKYFVSTEGLKTFDQLHHESGRALTDEEKGFWKFSVAGTAGVYKNYWSNGVWTEHSTTPILEKAKLPFIARKSASKDRFVAVLWSHGQTLLSNNVLACLHADPTLPNCPSGEEVTINGAILFHEGDLASLCTCAENTYHDLKEKDKVWETWHI
jgi:hypothetical protein